MFRRIPAIAFALALASSALAPVSMPAFGLIVVVLMVGAAVMDGRTGTAVALVGGWAVAVAGALLVLTGASLDPPAGARSLAGLAFVVFPMVLAALTVLTAGVFAVAHVVRSMTVPPAPGR